MSQTPDMTTSNRLAPGTCQSVSDAKLRLLTWAEESEAMARKSRAHFGIVAAETIGAVLLGLLAVRKAGGSHAGSPPLLQRVGRQVFQWTFLVQASKWLWKHAKTRTTA